MEKKNNELKKLNKPKSGKKIKEETVKPVVVEMVNPESKVKNIIMKIIKTIILIYSIGLIVGFNEFLLLKLDPLMQIIYSTKLMNTEFTGLANTLLNPIIFALGIFAWFGTGMLLTWLANVILKKTKLITDDGIKKYTIALAIAFFIVLSS